MLENAVFKFNGGNGALLCSGCSVIIKVGYQFNDAEREAAYGDHGNTLPPQYCSTCLAKSNENVQ